MHNALFFLSMSLSSILGQLDSPSPIPEISPLEQIIQQKPHKVLIIGRWRGFHEADGLTIYYGYDFKPDGTFLARHRVYEGETTLKDQFWQGNWDFDGKVVTVEGTLKDNPQETLKLQFRLEKDNYLYDIGTIDYPEIPRKMGKEGSI